MGVNPECRAGPSPGSRQVRVAVIDSDASFRKDFAACLQAEGFQPRTYSLGHLALEAFELGAPDLALIDLRMPDLDGLDLLRQIRARWTFPVMVQSDRKEEVDEVLALRLGADDFIRKPVSVRSLVERIRVRVRSAVAAAPPVDDVPAEIKVLDRGPLRMDAERHAVTWRGSDVPLTATEFLLLEALAQRPGYVKSRDQLMDVAYEEQVYVDDRTIDSHIKRLRKKMRAIDPDFSAIETLYGIGYRYSDRLAQ